MRFYRILSNPFVLGLFFFLAILYFITGLFPAYRLDLVHLQTNSESDIIVYDDLDFDGISEQVKFDSGYEEFFTILISRQGKIINHIRIDGNLKGNDRFTFCDRDNDGIKEIYALSFINDSIVLHCVHGFDSDYKIESIGISKCNTYNEVTTSGVINPHFEDINGDGVKDFVCMIASGYGIFPRNIFVYDFAKELLIRSPESCAGLDDYIIADLNGDHLKEIIITLNQAYGNCKSETFPDDFSCWVMVLDHNLNWFIKPVSLGMHPSMLLFQPLGRIPRHFIGMHIHRGWQEDTSKVFLMDQTGRILKKRFLEKQDYTTDYQFVRFDDYPNPICIENSGRIYMVDSSLQFIIVGELERMKIASFLREDLDCDGHDEFVISPFDRKEIIVYDDRFRIKASLKGIDIEDRFYYSKYETGSDEPLFSIYTDGQLYTLRYYKNPLYFLKFLTFILIYLGFVAIIYLIGRIQRQRLIQEYNRKRRMSELQVLSIQKQISPHFTLNILNSIGALINRNDKERMQTLLGKYSKILRYSLMNSDNIAVTLSEELEQVSNYLFLERFRMDGKFDYEVVVDEQTDREYRIPKTMLFTFVENAVKHGIRPMEDDGGMIRIKIKQAGKQIILRITDNGIGREKAASLPSLSTGKGLRILDEIIRIYSDLEKVRIRYWIEDLSPGNINPGTKVKIIVPLKY